MTPSIHCTCFRKSGLLIVLFHVISLISRSVFAFTLLLPDLIRHPSHHPTHRHPHRSLDYFRLYSEKLPDIASMRIGDIRNELESYGVSTAQFLEKKDMKDALEKARSEGKTPLNGSPSSNTTESTSPSTNATASTSENRSDRLKDAMEKARLMKVGDLKKELLARGVSTKTFFEKTEFVKAYAEAVVDGVSATSGSSSSGGANAKPEEPRDPDYRDVVVQKITRGDPRQIQGTVIDVTKK